MKRSAIVIAATAAGLAAVISFKPHGIAGGGAQAASTAGLTTGNANVTGAQTVVGSDQSLGRQPRRHPGQGHRRRTARSSASAWPG